MRKSLDQICGLNLDQGDLNAEFFERRNRCSGCPTIGNQFVYAFCWAEEILADKTEFAVISYHNLHFGVLHKFAQDFSFRGIRASEALFCIDAVDTDEHDVGEEQLGCVIC
jgi:hypothetical protein